MGDYEIEWTLEMLFTAKHLYDAGKMDDLMAVLTDFTDEGEFTFDFDMAPLLYEVAIGLIFEETRAYYNEETQQTTFVFWDTILYRYNILCRAYEARYGIAEIENPYVKEAEKAIHRAMSFGCMDYDYTWKTGTKHSKDSKLVRTRRATNWTKPTPTGSQRRKGDSRLPPHPSASPRRHSRG